jgi:hypothetical protein
MHACTHAFMCAIFTANTNVMVKSGSSFELTEYASRYICKTHKHTASQRCLDAFHIVMIASIPRSSRREFHARAL